MRNIEENLIKHNELSKNNKNFIEIKDKNEVTKAPQNFIELLMYQNFLDSKINNIKERKLFDIKIFFWLN